MNPDLHGEAMILREVLGQLRPSIRDKVGGVADRLQLLDAPLPPHNLDFLERLFVDEYMAMSPADRNTLGGLIEYVRARTVTTGLAHDLESK